MHRSISAIVALLLMSVFKPAEAFSQDSAGAKTVESEEIARIVGEAMTRDGAIRFLEILTDRIGGRVTGTAECRAAAELILKTLKESGYDNAHFEEYELASPWQRGPATAEVVSPVPRALHIGSYGWVPGTPGVIDLPVVDYGPARDDVVLPQSVRGAAVIVDLRSNGISTTYVGTRANMARRLAEAGAAAMFIISDKPNRMVYTSAFLFYPRGPLPVLSIANEDALFLRRLLAKSAVRIRLNVHNSFGTKPIQERNVVADLPGADPSEMVVLSAHFDAWDAAQGANDNGAGVAAILEAARIFKSINLRPRHTVRFVFFSGEEQGDLGSVAYAKQHRQELDKIRAVVNYDSGAQAPQGLQLYGRKDLEETTSKLLRPLAPLGADRVYLDADFDSDEESFLVYGVPAYSLKVENGDYDVRHHTIVDTFEKIDPRMLGIDTAVLAIVAYSFANAEERPGRRLSSTEVQELLKRTGLEPLYRLDYPISPY